MLPPQEPTLSDIHQHAMKCGADAPSLRPDKPIGDSLQITEIVIVAQTERSKLNTSSTNRKNSKDVTYILIRQSNPTPNKNTFCRLTKLINSTKYCEIRWQWAVTAHGPMTAQKKYTSDSSKSLLRCDMSGR